MCYVYFIEPNHYIYTHPTLTVVATTRQDLMCMLIKKHMGKTVRIARKELGKVCRVYICKPITYILREVNAHSKGFPEVMAKSYSKYKEYTIPPQTVCLPDSNGSGPAFSVAKDRSAD